MACVKSLGILCKSLSSVLIQAGWTVFGQITFKNVFLCCKLLNNFLHIFFNAHISGE